MARSLEGKRLLNKLITETTGFQRDEENFTICQNFVNSNLRFHRYLDVDSHKVEKSLSGLYEKFHIHSEIRQGELLKDKISQFLSLRDFERKDVAPTDTHWAVLAFLLDMSNSPTSQPYEENLNPQPSESIIDDFDWYRYLTEDLEPLQTEFSDSAIDSDEDEEDKIDVEVIPDMTVNDQDISRYIDMTSETLKQNLVIKYWTGEQDLRLLCSSDLAHDWNRYLTSIGSCETCHKDTYITEYQMVREILWVLSGARNLFLFIYNEEEGNYIVRPGVSLTHTTKDSVSSYLEKFLEFATRLSQLREFVMSFLANKYCHLICQTYQAFCVAIFDIIEQIDKFTTSNSKYLKSEEISTTLMSLTKRYEVFYQTITIIHDIYKAAIVPLLRQEHTTLSIASSLLLSKCNSVIDICQFSNNSAVIRQTIKVFIQTIQPYLAIIDEWFSKGSLNDPYNEFVVKKKNTECLDETFWNMAIEVTALEVTTLESDDTDSATDSFTFNKLVPDVLEGTLTKITITGKSMEMLSGLGKLTYALERHEKSLHEVFVERFCEEVGTTQEYQPSDVAHSTQHGNHCENAIVFPHSTPSLLAANLVLLEQASNSIRKYDYMRQVEFLDTRYLVNIAGILSKILSNIISERYKIVSESLLNVLHEDCQLRHYLYLIQKVFLLESGDMMYEFCSELFDKIRHEENWKDNLTLHISLYECLEKHLPADKHRFTISLVDVRRSELLPIHVLEQVQLHYEVDWPIDVIYDSSSELDYNKIFQFLLQVKLAKYLLDQLKFPDLTIERAIAGDKPLDTKDDKDPITYMMYIHRMRMLHVFNGLEQYVMTNIVYTAKQEFERELNESNDLEAIIQAHKRFVSTIYNRCFLHENNTAIRDCACRILNCALVFQRLWDSGLGNISMSKVTEVIEEFHRLLQIMLSFIEPFNKTGSLSHLEYLVATFRSAWNEEELVA